MHTQKMNPLNFLHWIFLSVEKVAGCVDRSFDLIKPGFALEALRFSGPEILVVHSQDVAIFLLRLTF